MDELTYRVLDYYKTYYDEHRYILSHSSWGALDFPLALRPKYRVVMLIEADDGFIVRHFASNNSRNVYDLGSENEVYQINPPFYGWTVASLIGEARQSGASFFETQFFEESAPGPDGAERQDLISRAETPQLTRQAAKSKAWQHLRPLVEISQRAEPRQPEIGTSSGSQAAQKRAPEEALATQLRYIQRSCEAFDRGHWDEAIRIATQLRVIFNSGGGSKKSLLQHLGVNRSLKLLSTCGGAPPEAIMYRGMGSYQYSSDGTTRVDSFYPPLDDTPHAYEMKFHEWWDQVVYVLPPKATRLRRRDIVLTAANKDGGAHFDENLTPGYEQLAAPGTGGRWVSVVDGVEQITDFIGTHFVCLRQMGYEVLHSSNLLALLDPPRGV